MTTGTAANDKGVGIGLAFGLLTFGAAAYTFAAPTQFGTALGFGAAMVFSVLAIAAFHVYGGS